MFRHSLILIGVIGLFGCNEGEPKASITLSKSELQRQERIQCEIQLLASKNSAPTISGPSDDRQIRFQPEYDRAAQVSVYLTIQQLLREGETGIDLLLSQV